MAVKRSIPTKHRNLTKLNQKLSELDNLVSQAIECKDYQTALDYSLQAHKLVPAHIAPLDRAMTICVFAKWFDQAVVLAKKVLARNANHINAWNALSHSYFDLKQYDLCREAGLKALTLTENSLGKLATPELPPVNLKADGKNIIAFSLFGDNPLYLENAILNTELVQEIYPNWVCRFYLDHTVPAKIVRNLAQNGAEIVIMREQDGEIPKTIWRFLAADDPNANYIIFRDADSVISPLEANIVNDWIASSQRFHTIRDSGSHTELILAGLWGMIAGSVPDMRAKIEQFVKTETLHKRFADQHFLRKVVWQYVRQDLYASDSVFGFGENVHWFENPFREQSFHIGCPEYGFVNIRNPNWQDGDQIRWQLYTHVAPKLNDDLSLHILPEERLICDYKATVKNGKVVEYAPRRYVLGIQQNATRVVTEKIST